MSQHTKKLSIRGKPLVIAVSALALVLALFAIPKAIAAVSAASATVPAATTVYGCDVGSSRTLEDVYTVEANFETFLNNNGGSCPNGFAVTVGGTNTTPTPTPTPTGTGTTTPPPTSSPTPTPTPTQTSTSSPPAATCTATVSSSSTADTECGPYTDSEISGTTGNINVDNNVWSPPSGSTWSQTINASGASSWNVNANFPSGSTNVLSFPNTGQDQNWLSGQTNVTAPLSSWSNITSSYNVTIPSNSGAVGEAAYDLWLNNWDNEVMIQTDFVGDSLRPRCDVDGDDITTQAFTNESGVSQNWNLCQFGSELIWQPGTGTNFSSDNINVMAMLTWLEDNSPSTVGSGSSTTTFLPANSDLTALSFGFEICSTGGTNDTWTVNDFSWTATPAASGSVKKSTVPASSQLKTVERKVPSRV
jgi:hypothetical protein